MKNSLKNLTFRGGGVSKNKYKGGDCLKGGDRGGFDSLLS